MDIAGHIPICTTKPDEARHEKSFTAAKDKNGTPTSIPRTDAMPLAQRPQVARPTSLKTGSIPSPLPNRPWGGLITGLVETYPPPPFPSVAGSVDNTADIVEWGVMANDLIGDCVVACIGHAIEAWTALASGTAVVLPDSLIVSTYSQITGYNSVTGANDVGMQISRGLDYWVTNGLGGHQLSEYNRAFGTRFSHNPVKQAIDKCGVCIAGIGVNGAILADFDAGATWGKQYGSATDHHCVPLIAYDDNDLECITWGHLQRMSWGFFDAYIDELYVVFGPDMFRANGQAFSGYNLNDMRQLCRNLSSAMFETRV
jgi:hypothetical protein